MRFNSSTGQQQTEGMVRNCPLRQKLTKYLSRNGENRGKLRVLTKKTYANRELILDLKPLGQCNAQKLNLLGSVVLFIRHTQVIQKCHFVRVLYVHSTKLICHLVVYVQFQRIFATECSMGWVMNHHTRWLQSVSNGC